MARSNAIARNKKSKSPVAKAGGNKSVSQRHVHQSLSSIDWEKILTNRPKVDFSDPFMRYAAMRAKGTSLCAFLVTLAAFQRGLKVTFNYELASNDPFFENKMTSGYRGELFSISNGVRTHRFSRTLGDLTDENANRIADDKQLTKDVLNKHGLRVPDGIKVVHSQADELEHFLQLSGKKRFVVKPLRGTLARGVHVDLSADMVRDIVARQSNGPVIVEEYVPGREYRATIVNGRCIAISWRERPYVVGDGTLTISQHIDVLRAKLRSNNPHWDQLSNKQAISEYLSRKNLSLETVIERNARVDLSNTAEGCLHHDVTDLISSEVKAHLGKVASAIGLVSCGIDLIIDEGGSVFVLEINQRSYIGMHSFPTAGASMGQGNAVAEAIVDYYFPETAGNRVFNRLAFDFVPVRAALESSQIAELSLPTVGSGWRLLRFKFGEKFTKNVTPKLLQVARRAGVFAMVVPDSKGGGEICLTYTTLNFAKMLSLVPTEIRLLLQQHDAKLDT